MLIFVLFAAHKEAEFQRNYFKIVGRKRKTSRRSGTYVSLVSVRSSTPLERLASRPRRNPGCITEGAYAKARSEKFLLGRPAGGSREHFDGVLVPVPTKTLVTKKNQCRLVWVVIARFFAIRNFHFCFFIFLGRRHCRELTRTSCRFHILSHIASMFRVAR